MEILSLIGIFVGLALLMVLAYRGHSIVWIAPFCAFIVALFALGAGLGEDRTLLTSYTVDYMSSADIPDYEKPFRNRPAVLYELAERGCLGFIR